MDNGAGPNPQKTDCHPAKYHRCADRDTAPNLDNLGRKKLNRRRRKHRQRIRDKIYKATHKVVDKAKTIVVEDLSAPIKGKSYGKDQNLRLSGWVKSLMAEALETVSGRRGSTLVTVNAAANASVGPLRKWILDTASSWVNVKGIDFTVSTGWCWTQT